MFTLTRPLSCAWPLHGWPAARLQPRADLCSISVSLEPGGLAGCMAAAIRVFGAALTRLGQPSGTP